MISSALIAGLKDSEAGGQVSITVTYTVILQVWN